MTTCFIANPPFSSLHSHDQQCHSMLQQNQTLTLCVWRRMYWTYRLFTLVISYSAVHCDWSSGIRAEDRWYVSSSILSCRFGVGMHYEYWGTLCCCPSKLGVSSHFACAFRTSLGADRKHFSFWRKAKGSSIPCRGGGYCPVNLTTTTHWQRHNSKLPACTKAPYCSFEVHL